MQIRMSEALLFGINDLALHRLRATGMSADGKARRQRGKELEPCRFVACASFREPLLGEEDITVVRTGKAHGRTEADGFGAGGEGEDQCE